MAMNGFLKCTLTSSLVVLAMSSCSQKLRVDLFNNTGEAFTVQVGDRAFLAEPGKFTQFDYPEEAQRWLMRLQVAKCDYTYQVPSSLEHYPWGSGAKGLVKVQLEKDLSIFLLPPSAVQIDSVANLGQLQQDGFPLHPASQSCR